MKMPAVLKVSVVVGQPRVEWCDRCALSHPFVDAYLLTERGVSMSTYAAHEDTP